MPLQAMGNVDDKGAVGYVRQYFEKYDSGRPRYTGSRFESFEGGGDAAEPNRITPADLVAVSMLSVHVPGQAALGIMNNLSRAIEKSLSEVDVDLRLQDLTRDQFERFLGRGSPMDRIWLLLRQKEDLWGIGQTTASKILARKRPHLVPIYDSVIAKQVGMRDSGKQWIRWWEAFQGEDGQKFSHRLDTIRTAAGQPQLSLLRVLDIVLWMDGHGAGKTQVTVDEREPGGPADDVKNDALLWGEGRIAGASGGVDYIMGRKP